MDLKRSIWLSLKVWVTRVSKEIGCGDNALDSSQASLNCIHQFSFPLYLIPGISWARFSRILNAMRSGPNKILLVAAICLKNLQISPRPQRSRKMWRQNSVLHICKYQRVCSLDLDRYGQDKNLHCAEKTSVSICHVQYRKSLSRGFRSFHFENIRLILSGFISLWNSTSYKIYTRSLKWSCRCWTGNFLRPRIDPYNDLGQTILTWGNDNNKLRLESAKALQTCISKSETYSLFLEAIIPCRLKLGQMQILQLEISTLRSWV